jgi:SAM-dependent methyltransferase
MFGHQFYPTPSHLAAQMKAIVAGHFKGREAYAVLDPSAGRGDLLDQFHRRGTYGRMLACEIDPDLRSVLEGKGYHVVHHDFLTLPSLAGVDAIVMNPPFDKGAEHVLHAWRILRPGGILVAVLNAETLRNPAASPSRRALAAVVESAGTAEGIGRPFKDATRKTDVECVLVTLTKPSSSTGFWDSFRPEMAQEGVEGFELPQWELAFSDPIKAKVASFDAAMRLIEESFNGLRIAANYLVGAFREEGEAPASDNYPDKILRSLIEAMAGNLKGICEGEKYQATADNAVLWATHKAWASIVSNNRGVMSMIPSHLRKELEERLGGFHKMAFNEGNIEMLGEMFYASGPEVGKQIILNAFNLMTLHHAGNRQVEKTWKTNNAYKVRQKFIMGYWLDSFFAGSPSHQQWDKMNDIDRAMCVLTGRRLDEKKILENGEIVPGVKTIYATLNRSACGEVLESEFFFIVKYPGVRSVHLTFKDKGLWQDFNQAVAKYNKWLPDATDGNNTGRHWKR